VELFLLPRESSSPPWQSLERSGLDLMHAMAFYCEVYRAIKDSCRTIIDYLTFHPDRAIPSPSPSPRSRFAAIFQDLPFMIFRHRLTVASWFASASLFPFRYATRAMVYTDGLFMNYIGVNPEDTHEQYHYQEPSAQPNPSARVAFITAIYGGYELTSSVLLISQNLFQAMVGLLIELLITNSFLSHMILQQVLPPLRSM
jgi:hypothetical protein